MESWGSLCITKVFFVNNYITKDYILKDKITKVVYYKILILRKTLGKWYITKKLYYERPHYECGILRKSILGTGSTSLAWNIVCLYTEPLERLSWFVVGTFLALGGFTHKCVSNTWAYLTVKIHSQNGVSYISDLYNRVIYTSQHLGFHKLGSILWKLGA